MPLDPRTWRPSYPFQTSRLLLLSMAPPTLCPARRPTGEVRSHAMAGATAPRMPCRPPRADQPRTAERRRRQRHPFWTIRLLLLSVAPPALCPAHRLRGEVRSHAMADATAPRMPCRLPCTGRPRTAERRRRQRHPLWTSRLLLLGMARPALYSARRPMGEVCSRAMTDAPEPRVPRCPPCTGRPCTAERRRRLRRTLQIRRLLLMSMATPPLCSARRPMGEVCSRAMADAPAPWVPRRPPCTGRPRMAERWWRLRRAFQISRLLLLSTAMADAAAPRIPRRLPRTRRTRASRRR